MVHSSDEVLDWLRNNPRVDRVLRYALNNHIRRPEVCWIAEDSVWRIHVECRSGRRMTVRVIPHTATGDPCRFFVE